jgi:hypothetical protein
VISEDRLELNLERAAHRETRATLARMTQAAQYYQAKAAGNPPLPNPHPIPIPIPTPTPVPDGGGGGQVVVVVSEMLEAAAQLARLALHQGGGPTAPDLGELAAQVRVHLATLERTLPAGTGVGDTHTPGGHRGYPPTQPQNPGRANKQGEHQNNPPPP